MALTFREFPSMPESLDELIGLAGRVLTRLDAVLPEIATPDWAKVRAAVWQRGALGGELRAHRELDSIELEDLLFIDRQKQCIEANTVQFVRGYPANNVLLWGARGTGKSSLIHALLNRYADQGLRLIELDKRALGALPRIVGLVRDAPYRFILVCDDLSFSADDDSYKELKSVLEGSVFRSSANVLIYATSNRRHLIPERMADNLAATHDDGELHESEAVEEKISLSDRFGVWLSFQSFKQDAYLDVVTHWLRRIGRRYELDATLTDSARREALQWALARGARNGRSAQYFARDWIGRLLTERSARP
jgi:predicted AAA+ superfamily ATPase